MSMLHQRHLIGRALLAATVFAAFAYAQQDQETKPASSIPEPRADRSLGWSRPRSAEQAAERRSMVAEQIAARGIRDPVVLSAMTEVPRHWFVPADQRRQAYGDYPLPIGEGQTISQPYIVALMTEALRLTKDSRVLEVGTGSGYQAAVLAEITPEVYTIEIVEPLGQRAIALFKERGYDSVKAKVGDGYAGWAEHAPFDAIIVTCAPDHVPPALVEQLEPGGQICIPIGGEFAVQRLVLLSKLQNGKMERKDLLPVRFVPMTGAAQERPQKD